MELRIIDGKAFIVTRRSKHETLTPASQVVAIANQRIKEAGEMMLSLDTSTADAQRGLEAALLKDEPTATFRAELANITNLLDNKRNEITDAEGDIAMISQLLDHHKATQIRVADADAISELLKPFTDFLETPQ